MVEAPEAPSVLRVTPITARTITRARVLYPLWCANAVAVAALDDRARLPLGLEARTSAPNASPRGDSALAVMMVDFRKTLSDEWTLTQAVLDASRYGTAQQLESSYLKLKRHTTERRALQEAIEGRTNRNTPRHRSAFFVQLPEALFESPDAPGVYTGYAAPQLVVVDAAALDTAEAEIFRRWRQEGPQAAEYPIAKRHARDGLEMVLRRRPERGVMDSLLRSALGDVSAHVTAEIPTQREVPRDE